MELDKNGSPFIPFPAPHQNLRITPPLYTDGPAVAKANNDPRVYMNLCGPPYPYTDESWDSWWPITSQLSAAALAELKAVQEGERKWVGLGAPFNTIREMNSDGTEGKFIGDIGIRRKEFLVVQDEAEKKRLLEVNNGYEAGDPRIKWEIGFYLSPEAHGRGIMPVALRLMMGHFCIPYMNAHEISGLFWDYNTASKRVFEKNGFEFVGVTPNDYELAENKVGVKGKKVGVGMMMWMRKVDE